MAKRASTRNGEKDAAGAGSGGGDGNGDGKGRRRTRRQAGKAEDQPRNALAEWTKSIIVAAILFLVLRTFLVQTFVITSGSMENTLLVGDMLVVNRAAMGSRIPLTNLRIPGYAEPHRGDVIVFDPPPPDTINMKLVKRLIGMPGDTLQMRNKVLYIDGKAQDEPYVVHAGGGDDTYPWMEWQKQYLLPGVDSRTYAPTRDNWGPLVIPAGKYFMMGDNRDESFDSRYWGLVERWRLEGRAVFVYYSYNGKSYRPFPWLREVRWGRIGHVIH
jgi:signal peptidase I